MNDISRKEAIQMEAITSKALLSVLPDTHTHKQC